jgi:hypothetical protein
MKNTTPLLATALLLVGYSLNAQTVTNTVNVLSGSSGPCPGSYQAKTGVMLNTTNGAIWVTVPAGKTSFVATYQGPTNNVPIVRSYRKHDASTLCGTNSVTRTVSASHQFRFEVFWKQTPTNAPTIATNLITWLP